jgi:hypothetical protein
VSRLEAIALRRATCPRCSAAPDHPCVTRTGRTATTIHADRFRVVLDGWQLGYREGYDDAVGHAARFLEREIDVTDDTISRLRAHLRRLS